MFPYFYGYYYDPTMVLVIIGMIISGLASFYIQSTFRKYSQIGTAMELTATEVSRIILDRSGLQDVRIERVPGQLTDHYDPNNKVLRLSDATAQSRSVAAIGVAAHEAGHALQDRDNYAFLRLRSSLVPITNIGQSMAFPILMARLFLGPNQTMINIGILLFSLTFIFQLITLPVEINASNRALAILNGEHLLNNREMPQAAAVLRAAAYTYIAGAISSFLSLFRLVLLFGDRNRRR